ncbi:formate dehydrogenase accessory sulfurtransferase FdhD [Nakamurella flavida]|uniref:Sulfur carrier protein FdhD n=1 Tax=Nakamurella flavida TaxID=363630 RepID=A0A938YGW1_9ACTN|nr:formate dehydrogenase accessory sulfurtransferase FdhD [Nakamurella flavida]MBM9474834.1 formate dehydrogenase accessory sulfurtransferase FdhD [Nakamurella flavida]MDP9776404.1 FdhD protein [Nakamurella flavida]
MSRVTVRTPIRRYRDGAFTSRPDSVAGEEPLEIRLDGAPLSVTMRTPGADIDLVHGLLHAEGLITSANDVRSARYCNGTDEDGRNTYNVIDVELVNPAAVAPTARRFTTSSACGVCGSESVHAITHRMRHPLGAGPHLSPAQLSALPDELRTRQKAFERTGGLHAAALVRPDGTLGAVREDVGRHNAVDKIIGSSMLGGTFPLTDHALLTSSRASFELVQKALLAGIGMLVAVSAPSSLAVQLATDGGLTLVGFTSTAGFNVYSGQQRIEGATV